MSTGMTRVRIPRAFAIALLTVSWLGPAPDRLAALPHGDIVVTTTAELVAAMTKDSRSASPPSAGFETARWPSPAPRTGSR